MIKRPFLIFITIVSALVAVLLWFIQSPHFAHAFKVIAARYIPKDAGINADFSEFSIKLFPPGFSIKNPRVNFEKKNLAGIPQGSVLAVERIDFIFRPIQIFSGNIRVHQVNVVNGFAQLHLDSNSTNKVPQVPNQKLALHWDELLRVRADAISLENIGLSIHWTGAPTQLDNNLEAHVQSMMITQSSGPDGGGYLFHLDVDKINGSYLRNFDLPSVLPKINCTARISALGLHLESLLIEGQGLEVAADGNIKGNILEPKNAEANIQIRLRGEIAKILKNYLSSLVLKTAVGGAVSFVGKIRGNLAKFLETLQVDGQVVVKNFSYQAWKVDLIQAQGQWKANRNPDHGSSKIKGELQLAKLILTSKEQPRMGGTQPGHGGKVEIGPVKWNIGSQEPVNFPIYFEKAHIHWLGAGALTKIYALDFRFNGKVQAKLTPPSDQQTWELQAHLDNTWLENFQLDNQRYRMFKPLNRLFTVSHIGLNGTVLLNSSELKPINVTLSLPHTKLHAGGKIDFEKGYNLNFFGPIKLDDLGQIAENKVQGEGTVIGRVHGSSQDVHVELDLDIKDAFYLTLFLGDIKGKITWEDGPNLLVFSKVKLRKGSTSYKVDGHLDLDTQNLAKLIVTFDQGNIQDLIQIFKNLTAGLDWFPHELNGPFNGVLKVQGLINLKQIQILGQLSGDNWEYLGERFKLTYLQGGYDQGKYVIRNFTTLKRTGRISGDLSYSSDQKFDWNFRTDGLTLSDFDHIAQADVPIRGRLKLSTSGTGKLGDLTSDSRFSLEDFAVRGLPLPSSNMMIKTERDQIHSQSSIMGGQGQLEINYVLNSKEWSRVHIELKHLDFSPILLLLNPKSMQDKMLTGSISGLLNLKFHAGEGDKANGQANINEYVLMRSDALFNLANPIGVQINDGNFKLNALKILGKSKQLEIAIENKGGHLNGSIYGELDTSIVEFFVPSVTQALGTSFVDLSIGGTLNDPSIFGHAELGGGSVRISSMDSPFENVTGLIQLKQNLVSVQDLQGDLGGGRVRVNGQVILHAERYPEVNLSTQLKSAKIKVFPFQYAQVTGLLGIRGEQVPYLIDGTVAIESALSKEKVLNRKTGGGEFKAYQYAPPTRQAEGNFSKFKLDIQLAAQKGVEIQNDLFRDVQVRGNLRLVNTLDAPRILGRTEILQGKIIFKDHVFQIQNASALFDNPTVINPSFDINANTEVNGIKVQMFATGRMDKIKFEFSSHPAMQENEILSLLAVGLTSNDAKKLSATDQSLVQQGEAASLVLHSLEFNRDLEDKTGLKLQFDEFKNPNQGVNPFQMSSQQNSNISPQITIRRKLGERLSLSAGSTVGVGNNRANQISLDFTVNKNFSLIGIYNSYSTSASSGVLDTQQNPNNTSMGLDLKFQKRFK